MFPNVRKSETELFETSRAFLWNTVIIWIIPDNLLLIVKILKFFSLINFVSICNLSFSIPEIEVRPSIDEVQVSMFQKRFLRRRRRRWRRGELSRAGIVKYYERQWHL